MYILREGVCLGHLEHSWAVRVAESNPNLGGGGTALCLMWSQG